MEMILDYINENGSITDSEIQTLLGVKSTRAYTIVKSMKSAGLITAHGRGTDKKYTL
jgi:ATP-dependent DNA helicase RecG